jgi:hypothetical protein
VLQNRNVGFFYFIDYAEFLCRRVQQSIIDY